MTPLSLSILYIPAHPPIVYPPNKHLSRNHISLTYRRCYQSLMLLSEVTRSGTGNYGQGRGTRTVGPYCGHTTTTMPFQVRVLAMEMWKRRIYLLTHTNNPLFIHSPSHHSHYNNVITPTPRHYTPHHTELPYSAAAWKLRPPKTEGQRTWADGLGFRYFLILQLGPNSSGNDCFFIGN